MTLIINLTFWSTKVAVNSSLYLRRSSEISPQRLCSCSCPGDISWRAFGTPFWSVCQKHFWELPRSGSSPWRAQNLQQKRWRPPWIEGWDSRSSCCRRSQASITDNITFSTRFTQRPSLRLCENMQHNKSLAKMSNSTRNVTWLVRSFRMTHTSGCFPMILTFIFARKNDPEQANVSNKTRRASPRNSP